MNKKGQEGFVIAFFVILFVVFLFVVFAFRIVNYNEYAFEKEFGRLSSDLKEQGIRYVGIGSLVRVSNQVRNYELPVAATSTDLQDVKLELNINMKLKEDKAYEFLKNYATEETYKQYLSNKMQERIKVIVLKYEAEDFIHKRLNISSEIDAEVKNIRELEYFEINDVSIKNIEFSDEFTKMLERKAQVDIERQIIIKENENVQLTKKNMELISDMDSYFKYVIAQKWNGQSQLTIVGGN